MIKMESKQKTSKLLTQITVLVIIKLSFVVSNGLGDDIDWSQMAFLLNDSCGQSWCGSDVWEGPPDAMGSMPPPPLPPFVQLALADNHSFDSNNENCNLCQLFGDPNAIDDQIVLPKPEIKDTDSWINILVATILGSVIFGAFFLVVLFKCKKWKIFPVSDSCPILPESFLGGHKSAPPPCSPTDSCISPVVNEKSPQSVITDAPMKKTSISSKYWKRGPNNGINSADDRTDVSTEMDPYSDAASCTSSPVYAELDPTGVTHALSTPSPLIMNGPSISPYAVCNTYSEVADAVRMAALGSSSALLPDASYDNAAYLPSANAPNIYHSRSLRRAHRAATLGQLGSATPLLQSHYHINGSPQLNYLTGGRPQKKPRPLHSQINSRRLHDDLQSTRFDRHGIRRQHDYYGDLPVHSPALSTFGVPNAFRDNPKRPLPPVPGVRL